MYSMVVMKISSKKTPLMNDILVAGNSNQTVSSNYTPKHYPVTFPKFLEESTLSKIAEQVKI